MSKPVHGDPIKDKRALQIAQVLESVDDSFCKNLDLKTLKAFAKVTKKTVALLEDAIVTKIQQSIGGMRGALRASSGHVDLTDL